jgi:hypothetical protein
VAVAHARAGEEQMADETTIVWNMQVTLDRQVAEPGETLVVHFSLVNALNVPMYIDGIAWNTNFYPVEQAVTQEVKKVIGPHGREYLGGGTIRVPEVPSDQYRIDVVAHTRVYYEQQWVDLGFVPLTVPKTFLVAHIPRYRAFVSRSLRPEDFPVADAMLPVIQLWGFDTHTVGINEFEPDPKKVSQRVLEEIVKADCVIGIATPRDVTEASHLVQTMAWLNSEASFAFAAGKPLALFVDESVTLQGFLASPDLAILKYNPADLPTFLGTLNVVMPYVRRAVERHVKTQALVKALEGQEIVAYGAFIAGTVHKKLPG